MIWVNDRLQRPAVLASVCVAIVASTVIAGGAL